MINLITMLLDRLVARFGADDRGEVSIEYVLVGGLAATAIIAGMAVLFPAVGGWFSVLANRVTSGM